MQTNLLKCLPLTSVVVALCLSTASYAQLTTYQQKDWLNSPAASSHVGNMTGNAHAAALPYRRYCVGCHGELGDGNGENAVWFTTPMYAQPRNFQLAIFKCRSTPTGTLPTDQDLYDTIGRGMDRSNMPSWNPLSNQERADLVAWIKHFSPRWQNEKPGTPIQIPPEPEVTPDRVKAGQAVFARMQCYKCHGVQGMANGPSASTLTDDLNQPIGPFNFTDGSRPKCGDTDTDIYRIFMTGLDGTPMPSFVDNIKPEEAWDLVFYLRSLQPHNAFNAKEREISHQLGLKPVDPNAPAQ
ncbi:MAG: cytochrome c [Terriglobales bacterium]